MSDHGFRRLGLSLAIVDSNIFTSFGEMPSEGRITGTRIYYMMIWQKRLLLIDKVRKSLLEHQLFKTPRNISVRLLINK